MQLSVNTDPFRWQQGRMQSLRSSFANIDQPARLYGTSSASGAHQIEEAEHKEAELQAVLKQVAEQRRQKELDIARIQEDLTNRTNECPSNTAPGVPTATSDVRIELEPVAAGADGETDPLRFSSSPSSPTPQTRTCAGQKKGREIHYDLAKRSSTALYYNGDTRDGGQIGVVTGAMTANKVTTTEQPNGHGEMLYGESIPSRTAKYVGEWSKGHREGKGAQQWYWPRKVSNKETNTVEEEEQIRKTYCGGWLDDKHSGQGVLVHHLGSNCSIYVGQFENVHLPCGLCPALSAPALPRAALYYPAVVSSVVASSSVRFIPSC